MARRRSGSFTRGHTSTGKTFRELREIGEHAVQAAKDALRQGADIIVQDAKSRCPVKTGKLRDSITAVSKNSGASYQISADAKNEKGDSYGVFVEFDPKINKPFMYPAMDANRNAVYENVKDAINNAINKGK